MASNPYYSTQQSISYQQNHAGTREDPAQPGAAVRTLQFQNTDEAKAWLHAVTMPPPIDPRLDTTINTIAADRGTWVLDMMDAIYDLSACHDNEKMKDHFRPHKTSFIIEREAEAACHILFDCLIDYCRKGFRGLPKTNITMTKGKKHHESDSTSNCQKRAENVILALRTWKSICKSIIEEDTKKWQLVNTPLAVMGKKEAERKCNSTKKKTSEEGKKAKDELVVMKRSRKTATPAHFSAEAEHQVEPQAVEAIDNEPLVGWHDHQFAADGSQAWMRNFPAAINFRAPALQTYPPFPPQQEPALYGLPHINHPLDWSDATLGWHFPDLQHATTQPTTPTKIANYDENLLDFNLDESEDSVLVGPPTEASDALAPTDMAPAVVGVAAAEVASSGDGSVVQGFAYGPPQLSSAVGSQHGIKRGREISDTDEDAPDARRQKLSDDH
ncbi:hypothetical protein DE146DRAFT_63839 [Phaeosphaeria sp. MPI-PUGE-AT-0046c]|nr:hypothetical protein DE146DRAFT_63839 [Phaeosphaeria sp. MPI-PUGE-AT-0046c]